MSMLSMVEAKLPPGFRFHPRDDELVCDYLGMKLLASGFNSSSMLVDVDLNKCEPWDLPETACVGGGKEWYFFSLRDRKYATGQRTNRATVSGYWKATGKDRSVARKGVVVGMRKTLVFYQGRAPKGSKTEWVMHEYRTIDKPASTPTPPRFHAKEDWVLCKVSHKSRGVSSKQTNCNEDNELDDDDHDEIIPPSLPPLLDNNYAAFEQAPQQMPGFEQVPCFSNSALPSCPTFSQFAGSGLNQMTCDKEVLKTVLDHFKMEPNPKIAFPPNLADIQGSLGAYLPVSGLPSHWNAF